MLLDENTKSINLSLCSILRDGSYRIHKKSPFKAQIGMRGRDTIPLFKQQISSFKEDERKKVFKNLLEVIIRWSEEWRDTAAKDIKKKIDSTGLTNLELIKGLI